MSGKAGTYKPSIYVLLSCEHKFLSKFSLKVGQKIMCNNCGQPAIVIFIMQWEMRCQHPACKLTRRYPSEALACDLAARHHNKNKHPVIVYNPIKEIVWESGKNPQMMIF